MFRLAAGLWMTGIWHRHSGHRPCPHSCTASRRWQSAVETENIAGPAPGTSWRQWSSCALATRNCSDQRGALELDKRAESTLTNTLLLLSCLCHFVNVKEITNHTLPSATHSHCPQVRLGATVFDRAGSCLVPGPESRAETWCIRGRNGNMRWMDQGGLQWATQAGAP